MSTIAAVPHQNPNSHTLETSQQGAGPIEKMVRKIGNFLWAIFSRIGAFFQRICGCPRREARVERGPPVEVPPPAQAVLPQNQGPVQQQQPPPDPLPPPVEHPEPIRNLARDLRAWRPPQDLLTQFESLLSPAERDQILERIGRAAPQNIYDAGMNWLWRDQRGAVGRYIEIGRDFLRKNPQRLIEEMNGRFPGA